MPTVKHSHSSSPSDDALIDTVIGGRYRITELIGRGGMASVYRALDESLPREVALKLMLPGMADPDEFRRQRNEVETLAALNHHALVTLFDAVTEPTEVADRVFLVMEFVDGPNLREVMTAPLPAQLVAHLGADIAEALHYMHARGIVHRDVKPANILLASSELPDRQFHSKLADFGIARLVDGAKMTSTGTIIGSASYLSPEQARGGEALGPSDVYSLGLVLLEALTGKDAFPGTAIETIAARLNTSPQVSDALSPEWRDVLVSMTALDAERRPLPMDVAVALRALAYSMEGVHTIEVVPTRSLVPPQGEAAEAAEFETVELAATELATAGLAATKAYTRVDTQATEAWAVPAASPDSGASRSTSPAATSSTTASSTMASPKRKLRLKRDSVTKLSVVVAIVLVLTVGTVAWSTIQNQSAAQSETESPEYPAVPGPLGTHLEQLQESVEP